MFIMKICIGPDGVCRAVVYVVLNLQLRLRGVEEQQSSLVGRLPQFQDEDC